MRVSFWFDPVCPFCWMTSRWLKSVAQVRDLEIDWQPISLHIKNNAQPGQPFHDESLRTRTLLRVVEAVRASGHEDRIGDLYSEFGRHIFHEQKLDFDVAAVLDGLGLDPALAAALDDESLDDAIRAAMAVGLELAGDDVGTPIIAVDNAAGTRVAFFGPVITTFPEPEAALQLWDGFVAMTTHDGFFELKRTRTSSPELPPTDKI